MEVEISTFPAAMAAVLELGELIDHILSLCQGETLWTAAQVRIN